MTLGFERLGTVKTMKQFTGAFVNPNINVSGMPTFTPKIIQSTRTLHRGRWLSQFMFLFVIISERLCGQMSTENKQ